MLSWIVRSSLKFRYLILAAAITMMAVGGGQLRHAKIDVFPEFAPPKVEIQTITLGLTASETEELVTVPLEQAINGIPHLDTISSKSVSAALVDQADLRSGHGRARGAAGSQPSAWRRSRRTCPRGRRRRS